MDLGLKDKVALVAAASSGLGKAAAMGLAGEGAKVAICARHEDALLKAAEEIQLNTGAQVLAVKADVTKNEDVKSFVDQSLSKFARIDILVSNSGGPPAGRFSDVKRDEWYDGISISLMSTINLCSEVIPHMRKQKWGRIVNITSIAAKQPIDDLILSNVSRAGVLGFSKTLSNEVAAEGITVNCVCPGYTKTERLEELAEVISKKKSISIDKVYQSWSEGVPIQRLADPREIAAMIVFLASERASYVTGTTIQIDGGMVRGLL